MMKANALRSDPRRRNIPPERRSEEQWIAVKAARRPNENHWDNLVEERRNRHWALLRVVEIFAGMVYVGKFAHDCTVYLFGIVDI
jgi:hypothetical protein